LAFGGIPEIIGYAFLFLEIGQELFGSTFLF